jgi:hypothetical protein
VTYSKIFQGALLRNRDGQIGVKFTEFKRCLKRFSGRYDVEDYEWEKLAQFLDQREDKFIT